MKPMRLITFAATAFFAATALCRAGDVANLEVLGFSTDGGTFAFEEYGVQDGSGFPYSNRYYIDTSTDKFLPGTPVRVRLDDENATLDAARKQSSELGDKIVKDADLNRGFAAGSNTVTELNADPHRMVVNPRPVFPPLDAPLEVRLEEIPLAASGSCEGMGETSGFRLLRVDARDGGQTGLLHEDKTIPQSRGCPLGYGIGGIQTFFGEGGKPAFAVLIAIRGVGFEGPDYRWIAVTGRL
jgi:predicted secreted protein